VRLASRITLATLRPSFALMYVGLAAEKQRLREDARVHDGVEREYTAWRTATPRSWRRDAHSARLPDPERTRERLTLRHGADEHVGVRTELIANLEHRYGLLALEAGHMIDGAQRYAGGAVRDQFGSVTVHDAADIGPRAVDLAVDEALGVGRMRVAGRSSSSVHGWMFVRPHVPRRRPVADQIAFGTSRQRALTWP